MGDDAREFDPDAYEDAQSFVIEYGRDLLDLLDASPDERVLDLGCGTGHVTADIAAAVGPGGEAVGLDASRAMVERAREAHPDLGIRHADATDFAVDETFDAVYSNAVLHWIDDQDAALACVADALRPGGRFVAELGADGNIVEILDGVATVAEREDADVPHPWHFPTLGDYTSRLESHGFEIRLARTVVRPTTLRGPDGLRDWFDQFGDELLAALPAREVAMADIEDELRGECYDPDEETWTVTYRRLQFRALSA
jgi:trans-aconitate methyltransferase